MNFMARPLPLPRRELLERGLLRGSPIVRTDDPDRMPSILFDVFKARPFDIKQEDAPFLEADRLRLTHINVDYCASGAEVEIDLPAKSGG